MKLLAAAALLLLLLAGCSGTPAGPKVLQPQEDGTYLIIMKGNRFVPSNAQVPVNATVVWLNDEPSIGHDVQANDGSFDSGPTAAMSGSHNRFEHRFTEPGTYSYVCMAHEGQGMRATLTVVAETA